MENVIWSIKGAWSRGLTLAVTLFLATAVLAAPMPQKAAANVGSSSLSTWSCSEQISETEARGRLYQSIESGNILSVYSYASGAGTGWDLDLQGTYNLGNGKTVNALTLDPDGNMYGVLQNSSGSNRQHQLIQIYPPSTAGGSGTFQVLSSYQHINRADRAVNSGAYLEIDGEGYLLMAYNGGGTNAALYKLSSGSWTDYNVNGQGIVKDMTWLPAPVTIGSVTYVAVGIEENNGNQTVLYGANGESTAVNTALSGFTADSSQGWGAAASYSVSSGSPEAIIFVRNDGVMAEWSWNNGAPSLVKIGDTLSSSDNDGGSCGDVSLTTIITAVEEWGPTISLSISCAGDGEIVMSVDNSASTVQGALSVTVNGANSPPDIDVVAAGGTVMLAYGLGVGATYELTVTPPFGSGFEPVVSSITYNNECAPTTTTTTTTVPPTTTTVPPTTTTTTIPPTTTTTTTTTTAVPVTTTTTTVPTTTTTTTVPPTTTTTTVPPTTTTTTAPPTTTTTVPTTTTTTTTTTVPTTTTTTTTAVPVTTTTEAPETTTTIGDTTTTVAQSTTTTAYNNPPKLPKTGSEGGKAIRVALALLVLGVGLTILSRPEKSVRTS